MGFCVMIHRNKLLLVFFPLVERELLEVPAPEDVDQLVSESHKVLGRIDQMTSENVRIVFLHKNTACIIAPVVFSL